MAIKSVTDANDLMIITKNGITIRLTIASLRVMGRATQGVRLINIQDNDEIAAVTKVDHEDETEEGSENSENQVTPDVNPDNSPENPENTTPTDNNG